MEKPHGYAGQDLRTIPNNCAFKQVDVFTDRPFLGNPVAVVLEADGLDEDQMLTIARWTHLSETTFIQQPQDIDSADYRVRIFSPAGEMAFAGHPSIGSAHAYLERRGAGGIGLNAVRQECGVGVVALSVEVDNAGRRIFLEMPPATLERSFDSSVEAISSALGVSIPDKPAPASFNVGPIWLVVFLEDENTVREMRPDMTAIHRLSDRFAIYGVTVFAFAVGNVAQVRVRSFAPAAGTNEDPVCGTGNAAVAAFLQSTGLISRVGEQYIATQGQELGRDGRVYVRIRDGGNIAIGGAALTVIEGEMRV